VTRVLSFNILNLFLRATFALGLGSTLLISNDSITFEYKDVPLKEVLSVLINNHNLVIVFPDTISDIPVSAECNNCTKVEAISSILSSTTLNWVKIDKQFIISRKILQKNFGLSGRVIDSQSREPISFANIYLKKLNIGDISNRDGTFSLSNISSQSCSLTISYIGYKTEKISLVFPKDENIFHEILLIPKIITTSGISILGSNREFMEKSNSPGQYTFSPRHISTLPNLGEVDIFRSLQFLPGVQLGLGESSDLYIRGGSADQNLIMLDGMAIYQIGHMFGFISGISSEAIKDIQVYKGSIPAQYGGRVSAVVDLTSRTGNNMTPHGAVYGNLLSQGVTLELPLFNKGSWIMNFRKSNPFQNYSGIYESIQDFITGDDKFNLLSQSANDDDTQDAFYNISSTYQDLVSRITVLANPRNRINFTYISGIDSVLEDREYYGFNSILGLDTIYIKEKTELQHQGSVINWYSKWNHNYNSHFSISNYIYSNNYYSKHSTLLSDDISAIIGNTNMNNSFSAKSIRFNQKYNGFLNHTLNSGIEQNYFSINIKNNNTDGLSTNTSHINQLGFMYSFFIQDQWKYNSKWEIHSGYRFSFFGERDEYYIEPRFALKYEIISGVSLETSIGKHHQFTHRFSNFNNNRWTRNIWIISSDEIPNLESMNYDVGLNWISDNMNFSINGYARELSKILFFQDSFLATFDKELIEKNIIPGTGTVKGIELLFRKNNGLISGWVTYQLNKTNYTFSSLNNGNSFFADHNKMHEFKSVAITDIFNINLTAVWSFSSGGYYTSEEDLYVEPGTGYEILIIRNQNTKELNPTHHLDISISKTLDFKPTIIDLGCSIYNVYDKKNISHKRVNPYTSEISIKDVAMFGITPTIFMKISF